MVSDRAQIVMSYHILFDQCEEERLGGKSFGSTKSGIAPFYYDWPLEYRISDEQGVIVYKYQDEEFKLSGLLPGETAESVFFIPEDLKAGKYTVQMRFVNPAEGVSKKIMPLRLSNDHEIRDGFYELAKVTIV